MPKKFVGENSKAVAAKARKAAAQEEQAQKKQKQIEDEYWRDDDKTAAKKTAKKVNCRSSKSLLILNLTPQIGADVLYINNLFLIIVTVKMFEATWNDQFFKKMSSCIHPGE